MKRCKVAYYDCHDNGNHFLVVYDHMAGRKDRYTVFVWRVGKTAKIIGRELPLDHARRIVDAYPKKPAD